MKRKVLATIIFLFAVISAFGQNYVGPSPNSMGIMRLANQVNYFTGSPSINIPLASLPGKELSASVSLSYNSFGHRVQDVASSEGLGWSLIGGGVITRVVRGEPDDHLGGYCNANPTDTEPDIFTFSVGGISGKFVLDKVGIPILMPYQDIIIKPGICRAGSTGGWEIIDSNGVKYYLGTTSDFRETTSYRKTTETPANAKSYTSSWLLDRVISPNNTDVVNYTYTSGSFSYENYSLFMDTGSRAINPNVVQNNTFFLIQNVKHLSAITTSAGSILFSYDGNRQDLAGGKHLTGIRVNDHLGVQVSKLSFQYGYFGSGLEICKRLRLEEIRDLGSNPLYTFTYNQINNLPCRNSQSIDYLGLYNNYLGTSWIPSSIENIQTGPRSADPAKMQSNLLTRIDTRGGGYTIYDFEPHSGFVKVNQGYIDEHGYTQVIVVDQQISTLSGNRISKIRMYDGMGGLNTTDYKYEKQITQNSQLVNVTSGQINRLPLQSLTFGSFVTRKFSHNISDLFDLNGVYVGYTRVLEIQDNKGQTEYIFSEYGTPQILNIETPISFLSTRFWERGLLLSKKLYKQEDLLNFIYSETYEYDLNLPQLRTIQAKEMISVPSLSGIQNKESNYTLISKPITLTKKTAIVTDQNIISKTISSEEQYGYQAPTYQLSNVTSWNSTNPNEKSISTTKYITHPDYNYNTTNCETELTTCINNCTNGNSSCENNCYVIYNNCKTQELNAMGPEGKAITKMREWHMNNTVVESQNFIQRGGINYLIAASINKYTFINGMVFPQSKWISKKNSATNYTGSKILGTGVFEMSPLFVETANQTYGLGGKLTSQTNRDGLTTDFTYSNNNTSLASQTISPASNPFTTLFEYKPLVGVTKETDPNIKAVNMEYDGLNRLRIVKDNNNNIRERYRYHSKNETPNFRIAAASAQIMAGQSITFSLEDIFVPTGGTTTRYWTTGTGTSYTDNRQTMSHTYTTPGLYTITSTLLTNEYSSIVRSFDLLVTGPLQISMCVNGPQEKDLCNPANRVWGSCTASQVDTGYTRFQVSFSPPTSTGCVGMYNYNFQYSLSRGSWITFSDGPQDYADFIHDPNAPGNYSIRCIVTDSCNATAIASSNVNIYKSNPSCTPINY